MHIRRSAVFIFLLLLALFLLLALSSGDSQAESRLIAEGDISLRDNHTYQARAQIQFDSGLL